MELKKISIISPSTVETSPCQPAQLSPKLYFPTNINESGLQHIDKYETSAFSPFKYIAQYKKRFNIYRETQKQYCMSPGVNFFWSFLQSSTKIYFLDKYLELPDVSRIIYELNKIKDFRGPKKDILIICDKKNATQIRPKIAQAVFNIAVASQTDALVFIHDRFAVLDDYIWHFGAKIGGMHECMNAFSGPWLDAEHTMQTLCESFR